MRYGETLQLDLSEGIVTGYRDNPCMRELYCTMRRKFGELIYLGILYVVLPHQADLENVTKVVIDDLEGGGRVWVNHPFVACLDTSNIYIFQYICMYVYIPVYI